MSAAGIPIVTEVIFDSQKAISEMEAFRNELRNMSGTFAEDTVRIPISINDTVALQQMAAFRNTLETWPIVIPVSLDFSGSGLPPGMNLSTLYGGGGGALAGPSAVPEIDYNALGRARLGLPPAQAGGVGAETAIPVSEDGAADGGAVATGSFFGSGFRGAMHAALVARAIYDVGDAGYDAIRAYNADDAGEAGDFARAGQKAIGRIPLVGGPVEGLGEGIERFGDAASNYFVKGKGYGEFESDQGYAERLGKEQAKTDEKIEAVDKEIAARKRLTEHLEKETLSIQRKADMDAVGGSYDRAAVGDKDELADLDEELKKPQYRKKNGDLTDDAWNYRAAKRQEMIARAAYRQADETIDLEDLGTESDAATMENQGDMEAAKRARFSRRLDKQQEAAYKRSKAQGDYFKTTLRPQLETGFEDDIATDYISREAQHNDIVASIKEAGEETSMRSQNRGGEASLSARNFALDQSLQKKQEAVDSAQDSQVKARLQDELDKMRPVIEAQKSENQRQYEHARGLSFLDIGERTKELGLRTAGHGQQADEQAIQYSIARAIEEESDPVMKHQLMQEGAARLRAFAKGNDHVEAFNSLGDYMTRVNVQNAENDPAAKEAALKAADKLDKSADKLKDAADKFASANAVVLDI